MRHTTRSRLVVLALIGAAALFHPVAVTAAHAQGDSGAQIIGYGRLGFSTVFAERARPGQAIGIGIRAELDAFAVDVSALNFALRHDRFDHSNDLATGSWLKLSAIRFIRPHAEHSAYVGGGLSWGVVNFGRDENATRVDGVTSAATSWHGDGLQGELTLGYELARGSGVRLFAQADGTLPFFRAASYTWAHSLTDRGVQRPQTYVYRYVPSVVLSVGVGWQRR